MNKLKKVGISALAGTLVSLSAAQAGGVGVSGNWELSYTNLDNGELTGNRLGMNKNISFSIDGDVTSGGGVTWGSSIAATDAMGLSSAYVSLNFGGIMTLTYDSGDGSWGANAVDNIVPTAWEEIDYGFSTGLTDVGAVSSAVGVVNMTVKAPGVGSALSVSYNPRIGAAAVADGGTSGADVGGGPGWDAYLDLVNANMQYFGFRLGVGGEVLIKGETCKNKLGERLNPADVHICDGAHYDHPYAGTAYSSLRVGPFSFGFQGTYKDNQETAAASVANNQVWLAGSAITIGDYISVSYGRGMDKYQFNNAARSNGEHIHSHFEGYSAAINMGPVALKATDNAVSNINGTSASDRHREINLSIAF